MPKRPTNPTYDLLARHARRVWLAVLAAVMLIALATFVGARHFVDTLASVEHTRQVDAALDRTLTDLLDVGYGTRGYVITGSETFLAPFVRARRTLPESIAGLRRLVADNDRQLARLDEFELVAAERMRFAIEVVELRRQGRADRATEQVRAGHGKQAADQARALLAAMRAEEGALLANRQYALRRAQFLAAVAVASALTLLIAAAAVGCLRFPRLVRELGKAQHELRVNRELYRTLLRSLPDAAAFLFDPDLRLLLIEGDRLLGTLGLDKRVLRGVSILDLVSEANRAVIERAYRAAFEGDTSTFDLNFDGRDFSVAVAPVRDDAGAIVAGLALARDVTERKRTQAALEAERATLRAVLDAMQDVVVVADVGGNVTLMNPAARAILDAFSHDGASPPSNRALQFFADGALLADEASPMARALRGERVDGLELALRTAGHPSGRWHSLNATPVRGEAGSVRGAVCVGRDVTEQRRAREALRQLSTRDELTGLYNRRGFLNLAEDEARAAARTHRPFSLIFIDLNGMKLINDRLGHEEGDRALFDTANLIRHSFRAEDLAARLGGDEFVVFAPGIDGPHAERLVVRLRDDLARHNETSGRLFHLSLSAGVAPFDPSHPESIDQLLGRADARMYEYKRTRTRSTFPVRGCPPEAPASLPPAAPSSGP